MRFLITLGTVFWAGQASAHAGHIIDLAGHDHLAAGAAIGIAIAIGLVGAAKGRKKEKSPEPDVTQEEAPA